MFTAHARRSVTITFSTLGQVSRASSTTRFTGICLCPRFRPSLVSTIVACASWMRSLRLCALKPQNTTLWMAPMRAQASVAITSSGTMGM
jgi:hypothetical protein